MLCSSGKGADAKSGQPHPTGSPAITCYDPTNTTTPHNMYTSYEESVLDHADEHGNLSYADATRLLADHGFTWKDLYDDNYATIHWGKVQACHAETLLDCLGY